MQDEIEQHEHDKMIESVKEYYDKGHHDKGYNLLNPKEAIEHFKEVTLPLLAELQVQMEDEE